MSEIKRKKKRAPLPPSKLSPDEVSLNGDKENSVKKTKKRAPTPKPVKARQLSESNQAVKLSGVPDQKSLNEAIRKISVRGESVSKNTSPAGSIPKENIPKESPPNGSLPKESPRESCPEERTPQQNVPVESVSKEDVDKECDTMESVSKNTVIGSATERKFTWSEMFSDEEVDDIFVRPHASQKDTGNIAKITEEMQDDNTINNEEEIIVQHVAVSNAACPENSTERPSDPSGGSNNSHSVEYETESVIASEIETHVDKIVERETAVSLVPDQEVLEINADKVVDLGSDSTGFQNFHEKNSHNTRDEIDGTHGSDLTNADAILPGTIESQSESDSVFERTASYEPNTETSLDSANLKNRTKSLESNPEMQAKFSQGWSRKIIPNNMENQSSVQSSRSGSIDGSSITLDTGAAPVGHSEILSEIQDLKKQISAIKEKKNFKATPFQMKKAAIVFRSGKNNKQVTGIQINPSRPSQEEVLVQAPNTSAPSQVRKSSRAPVVISQKEPQWTSSKKEHIQTPQEAVAVINRNSSIDTQSFNKSIALDQYGNIVRSSSHRPQVPSQLPTESTTLRKPGIIIKSSVEAPPSALSPTPSLNSTPSDVRPKLQRQPEVIQNGFVQSQIFQQQEKQKSLERNHSPQTIVPQQHAPSLQRQQLRQQQSLQGMREFSQVPQADLLHQQSLQHIQYLQQQNAMYEQRLLEQQTMLHQQQSFQQQQSLVNTSYQNGVYNNLSQPINLQTQYTPNFPPYPQPVNQYNRPPNNAQFAQPYIQFPQQNGQAPYGQMAYGSANYGVAVNENKQPNQTYVPVSNTPTQNTLQKQVQSAPKEVVFQKQNKKVESNTYAGSVVSESSSMTSFDQTGIDTPFGKKISFKKPRQREAVRQLSEREQLLEEITSVGAYQPGLVNRLSSRNDSVSSQASSVTLKPASQRELRPKLIQEEPSQRDLLFAEIKRAASVSDDHVYDGATRANPTVKGVPPATQTFNSVNTPQAPVLRPITERKLSKPPLIREKSLNEQLMEQIRKSISISDEYVIDESNQERQNLPPKSTVTVAKSKYVPSQPDGRDVLLSEIQNGMKLKAIPQ